MLSPELQRYRISMLTKQMMRSDPFSITLSVDGKSITKKVDDLHQYEYALSGGFSTSRNNEGNASAFKRMDKMVKAVEAGTHHIHPNPYHAMRHAIESDRSDCVKTLFDRFSVDTVHLKDFIKLAAENQLVDMTMLLINKAGDEGLYTYAFSHACLKELDNYATLLLRQFRKTGPSYHFYFDIILLSFCEKGLLSAAYQFFHLFEEHFDNNCLNLCLSNLRNLSSLSQESVDLGREIAQNVTVFDPSIIAIMSHFFPYPEVTLKNLENKNNEGYTRMLVALIAMKDEHPVSHYLCTFPKWTKPYFLEGLKQ